MRIHRPSGETVLSNQEETTYLKLNMTHPRRHYSPRAYRADRRLNNLNGCHLDSETTQKLGSAGGSAVDKIDRKVSMNPLLGMPKEHLQNMKMAITTAPYNGANNLLVFNTWLNELLMYCLAYELTGPTRDLTCINVISGALW
jgi:hypothetical protein